MIQEYSSGLLSRDSHYLILINGTMGLKQINRLIQKLQIDKEIWLDAYIVPFAKYLKDKE
jgi:hypothetical protein